MLVFHFLPACHGLDNIHNRRLKLSLLNNLNDPFDLMSLALDDPRLRSAWSLTIDEWRQSTAILCFSRSWRNPVQWSHYADRHQGLCLGFEVPDHLAMPVVYVRKRLADEARALLSGGGTEDVMHRLLTTKYHHWRYEQEVRCFVNCDERDPISGHYFVDFSEKLNLVQVLVGARSSVSRADLRDALGPIADKVEAFKVRPAFRSFAVVRNRDSTLWR